jgi:hypothetical protein
MSLFESNFSPSQEGNYPNLNFKPRVQVINDEQIWKKVGRFVLDNT